MGSFGRKPMKERTKRKLITLGVVSAIIFGSALYNGTISAFLIIAWLISMLVCWKLFR